jgi:hypothetical protein
MLHSAVHFAVSLRTSIVVAMFMFAAALPGCGRLVSRTEDGKMLARIKPASGEASSKAIADDPFPSAAQAGIAGVK